jgi:serine protease inhibitor
MKKSLIILVIFTIIGGLSSCNKNKGTENPKSPVQITLSQQQKDLVVSNNAFGLEIFRAIASNDTESVNSFISPLSISLALAMTYNGSNGATRTEMQNTLQFPNLSQDEINGYFQKLTDELTSIDSRVNLKIANSIWYRQGFSVLPSFLQVNQDYYDANVQSLDFNNPASVNTINNWVSDKTNNRIQKVINNIDPTLVMFLINAIYFKGSWSQEFEKNGTHEQPFYLTPGSSINVPMMHQKGSFNYLTSEKFRAVEMPYGQGNFTMLVLLPKDGYSASDITSALTAENWDSWTSGLNKAQVEIRFPRFKFEYERTLNDDLKSLGMIKAFSDTEADFTNINPNGGLYISFVKHNSFVEVNETGTEAAAVTTVGVGTTSAGPPQYIDFNANKPFIFAIRESTTNAILFMGKVCNPQ